MLYDSYSMASSFDPPTQNTCKWCFHCIHCLTFQVRPPITTNIDHTAAKKILLKVSFDDSCKLSTLIEMRVRLAAILGITPAGLRLTGIEGKCVITFQIVGILSELVFRGEKADIFTQEKMWKLQALTIQWLKCGSYEWDFTCDVVPGTQCELNLVTV